jgi:uncharacterized membrane protein
MRVGSIGQVFFALVMVGLGVLGLVSGAFASVWQPVPKEIPGREILAYASAAVSLAGGMGLLWESTAAAGARLLTVYLLLWLLVLRMPAVFAAPLREVSWSGCGESAVLLAGSFALHAALAPSSGARFAVLTGVRGMTAAQYLFGFALVPCGLAHFAYAQATAELVPRWLPGHLFWAYATGTAYIVAAAAILFRHKAHEASNYAALMMSAFTVVVWAPRVAKDPAQRFVWTALLISSALSASAWVVADSFRRMPESTPSTPLYKV